MSEVIVASDGTVRAVYDDRLMLVLERVGVATIRRASHVEPDGRNRWRADLSPVRGPVLGPFRTRALALEAEARWLLEHGIPEPQ